MKNIKNKKPSTQKSLPLAEVRNDCLIMKDGTLRAILMVSSINFALKSSDEQQAIIQAYMQFLNSFDYPLQIVVQSRKLNIEKYLDKLKQIEKEQPNELLKMQIVDYRNYVAELVKIGDIMTKKFYLIVPYDPLSDKKRGFWPKLGEVFSPASAVKLSEDKFLKRKRDLWQRVGHVASSLSGMGLQVATLNTQQLIELLYNCYNPDLTETEKVASVAKIEVQN